MKNKCRNHSAQFKVEVALAAIKGEKAIAELTKKYCMHPAQITQWKKERMGSLPDIFSARRKKERRNQAELPAQLYQQIG